MAGTYPPLLAGGVDNLGRFDQFDLFAGEGETITSQAQAKDAQEIRQFEVLAMDVDGRLVPWDASEFGYSSGTLTFTGNPTANETVTINSVAITFKASGATGAQVNIDTDYLVTAQNLVDLINGVPDSVDPNTLLPVYGSPPLPATGVTASRAAGVVTLHAITPGVAGDSITLAEAATNVAKSDTSLAGGAAETDTHPLQAIGIAAQAAPSTSPGTWLPYFTGGVFNHEVLIWPNEVATLAQRKRAFAGTDISVGQLL